MTQKDKTELFNDYKLLAFKLAYSCADKSMEEHEIKGHAMRALWRMVESTEKPIINKKFLRGGIKVEMESDRTGSSYWRCIKSKGHKELDRNVTYMPEVPEVAVDPEVNASFEFIPDNMDPRAKQALDMKLQGYSFSDAARKMKIRPKTLREYMRRKTKETTFDL